MGSNTIRLAVLIVGIIIGALVYFGFSGPETTNPNDSNLEVTSEQCTEHYYVGCYDQDFETTEDYISCQTDDDCQEEELFNYCYPDDPDLIWCDQGYYYCEEEVCVLCDCPISESDIEAVNNSKLN